MTQPRLSIRPYLLAASLSMAGCAPMGSPGHDRYSEPERREAAVPAGSVINNLQQQLQQTAEALKLSPTQAVLWDSYQDKIGALMSDQMKLQPYRAGRSPAPQQIAQKVDAVRHRLTALEDIEDAANHLYAALTPSQQATADQLLPNTIPTLYSGLSTAGATEERSGNGREGRGGPSGNRGGPGGGMGGMGGGMGGGLGR